MLAVAVICMKCSKAASRHYFEIATSVQTPVLLSRKATQRSGLLPSIRSQADAIAINQQKIQQTNKKGANHVGFASVKWDEALFHAEELQNDGHPGRGGGGGVGGGQNEAAGRK